MLHISKSKFAETFHTECYILEVNLQQMLLPKSVKLKAHPDTESFLKHSGDFAAHLTDFVAKSDSALLFQPLG